MKPKVKFLIALGVTILALVLILEFQPNVGWVFARLGCLVFAALLAWFTYSGTQLGAGLGDAKNEYKDIKTRPELDSVDAALARWPFLAWFLLWAVTTQIMVSFYIAEL